MYATLYVAYIMKKESKHVLFLEKAGGRPDAKSDL